MKKKKGILSIIIVIIIALFWLNCSQEQIGLEATTTSTTLEVYTITYNLDGGTNNVSNPATYTVATPTITLSAPTKSNYTFGGWYTDAGFITSKTQIALGSTGAVTLYAKWTHNDLVAVQKREIVPITGGTYTQTDGTNSFEHTISDFSMGKYEVTYELWYTVYQWAIANGYTFANAGREGSAGGTGTAPTAAKYEPVTTINWRDTIVWCNAYSEMSGLTPCYSYSSATIKDSRDTNATACDGAVCNWSANGYRLPSEGEWQYAASNKGATPWNYASGATADYNDATETGKVAWYSANSGGATHDVGTTTNPSALTLWDMSGNVFEWCWDWYGAYPGASTDYRGSVSGSGRILRGGGWSSVAGGLQIGDRDYYGPYSESDGIGFRIARTN